MFGVLGSDAFEFLATRGANLGELLRPHHFLFMSVERGSRGDVLRLRLGELGTEDPRERLSLFDMLSQLGGDARDPSSGDRRDIDLSIRIGFDGCRQAKD